MTELHIGLVHHPIFDRNKNIVATTVTHFDVHDIARVCRSYGVVKYHIIHPSESQLMFVARLKEHWSSRAGKEFNPLRAEAMKIIAVAKSIDEINQSEGFDKIYSTSAKNHTQFPSITFSEVQAEIKNSSLKKILILFGTGSGLVPTVFEQCHALIEPIVGFEGSDFRHLSVRSAVAIVLDRIHRA
jgi:hypothetical protein